MEEVLKYIYLLESESFVGWTQEEINGYLTACGSIKKKIEEILENA